jgi:NADH-quinone oxidoreductase subunit G
MPRYNPDVNQYWMCDEGRMTAYALQGEGRLLEPLVRGEDRFARADWVPALVGVAERLARFTRTPGAVGVVVSARATNEEVFLLRRLAAASAATLTGVSWSPPNASHDDLLIKADKNPNTRGLALQGVRLDGTLDALLEASRAGTVQALVVFRADMTRWRDASVVRAALERVPYLVVLDTDQREIAEYSSVLLPVGTHAEMEGTFTNHADRVQRFHRAVDLPGNAREGWWVLSELVSYLTGGPPFRDAAGVFAALAAEGGAFRDLAYEQLGNQGRPAAAS